MFLSGGEDPMKDLIRPVHWKNWIRRPMHEVRDIMRNIIDLLGEGKTDSQLSHSRSVRGIFR